LLAIAATEIVANDLPSTIDVVTARFDLYPPKFYEMRAGRLKATPGGIEALILAGQLEQAESALDGATDSDEYQLLRVRMAALNGRHTEALRVLSTINADRRDLKFESQRLETIEQEGLHMVLAVPVITQEEQTSPDALLAEGLAGSIDWLKREISGGWLNQSVNAHYTLSRLLSAVGKHDEAIYAWFRASELDSQRAEESGTEGLITKKGRERAEVFLFQLNNGTTWKEHYTQLRKQADHWREQRLAYLNSALDKGEHPDIDPTFWEKLALQPIEVGPQELAPQGKKPLFSPGNVLAMVGSILVFLSLIFIGIFVVWLRKRPPGAPTIDEL
jgi:tetratricopeptide (TPR) repeat protein